MLVEFNHVGLSYDKHRTVLSDINFTLPFGGFYFLCGPSGAGKSSLLRLIYLGARPTSGRVRLFGRDTGPMMREQLPALRRRIGVVFQDFRLIPHLSAFENTALPLRLAGQREDFIKKHASELLQWVGLGNRLNALPAELSGGEQQRVAIARAVVNNPALLLADEPTGNMDEDTAVKLMHLFVELNKMGTGVLFATHQPHLVKRFDKPSLWLKGGQLVPPFPPMAKAA